MTAHTFLWNQDVWKVRAGETMLGKNLYIDHIASDNKDKFTNFHDGDEIFVVTVMQGQLFVGGRLVVGSSPVDRDQAIALLGRDDLINKKLFVLANVSHLDKFRSGKPVDSEAARNLDLITTKGVCKKPNLDKKNMLDKQAFRFSYELSQKSATVLRECLGLSKVSDSSVPIDSLNSSSNQKSGTVDTLMDTSDTSDTSEQDVLEVDASFDECSNEIRIADLRDETNIDSDLIATNYSGRPGEDVKAIVKRRLGQGSFRRLLEELQGVACCVSGLRNRSLLIASHIIPWSESTPYQKTDPENGLLLSVNWDALFDKGFISFDEAGQLLCASKLDEETIVCLGVSREVVLETALMTEERKRNLLWHREMVFNR